MRTLTLDVCASLGREHGASFVRTAHHERLYGPGEASRFYEQVTQVRIPQQQLLLRQQGANPEGEEAYARECVATMHAVANEAAALIARPSNRQRRRADARAARRRR